MKFNTSLWNIGGGGDMTEAYWDLRSSLDAFGASLGTGTINTVDSWAAQTVPLPGLISVPSLELRLYLADDSTAGGGNRNYRMDEFRIEATSAIAVPEGEAFGVGLVALFGLLYSVWARRRSLLKS